MQQLIAALGKDIKHQRDSRWIARCPVHNDSDFAMGIRQTRDGSVIANCFACGANGYDLYRCLGLDLTELFGGNQLAKDYIPPKLKDGYEADKWVVKLYEADQKAGKKITFYDKKRYRLACARIKGVEKKYGHLFGAR